MMMKTALLLLASITVAWSYPGSMATSANNGFPPFDNSLVENRDQEPPTIQEFYSNDATEDSAAVAASVHPDTEVIAQAVCSTIAGPRGWTYAVQRLCKHKNRVSCTQICTSQTLRNQDQQTRGLRWFAAAALHVYNGRPSSTPGTATSARLGLKVYRYADINRTSCGPNYCCCHVPTNFSA